MEAIPNSARATYNYSLNLLNEGKTSEALTLLLRSQASLPSDRTGVVIAGILYENVSKTSATHYLDKVISTFPKSALPYMAKGDYAKREKRLKEALELYKKAYALDNNNSHLLYVMGNTANALKETTAALKYYRESMKSPSHPQDLAAKIRELENE